MMNSLAGSMMAAFPLILSLGCSGSVKDDALGEIREALSGHVIVADTNNVYSPTLLWQGGTLYMYYGGWRDPGQTHDAIYRATCSNPYPCSPGTRVIDPVSNGFEHTNDPTIVLIPASPRPYYVMYITGVIYGQDGLVAGNNHIYYSTSWADDGLNWSTPTLLDSGHWLPSATLGPDNHVYLYGNSNVNGVVDRADLGTGGTSLVAWRNVPAIVGSNVDVMYRPSIGLYQILAENAASTRIDYFDSTDGLNWSLRAAGVIQPAAGQKHVRTPAPHPDTHGWAYFGETLRDDGTGNHIAFGVVD